MRQLVQRAQQALVRATHGRIRFTPCIVDLRSMGKGVAGNSWPSHATHAAWALHVFLLLPLSLPLTLNSTITRSTSAGMWRCRHMAM